MFLTDDVKSINLNLIDFALRFDINIRELFNVLEANESKHLNGGMSEHQCFSVCQTSKFLLKECGKTLLQVTLQNRGFLGMVLYKCTPHARNSK